ncbi:hypothetical protein F7725_001101, partial [Dissostichus mawsoni]
MRSLGRSRSQTMQRGFCEAESFLRSQKPFVHLRPHSCLLPPLPPPPAPSSAGAPEAVRLHWTGCWLKDCVLPVDPLRSARSRYENPCLLPSGAETQSHLSASSYSTPTSMRSLAGEMNSREKAAEDVAGARVNRLRKYDPAQASTARCAENVRLPTCRNTSQYWRDWRQRLSSARRPAAWPGPCSRILILLLHLERYRTTAGAQENQQEHLCLRYRENIKFSKTLSVLQSCPAPPPRYETRFLELVRPRLAVLERRERTGVAVEGDVSLGQPCWSKISMHPLLPFFVASFIAVWPWLSFALTSIPYCEEKEMIFTNLKLAGGVQRGVRRCVAQLSVDLLLGAVGEEDQQPGQISLRHRGEEPGRHASVRVLGPLGRDKQPLL